MPYPEVPAFMGELAGMDKPALALRFLILTASRTGEVLGAPWSEIDTEAGIWTVPAIRMKASESTGFRRPRPPWSFWRPHCALQAIRAYSLVQGMVAH